MACQLGLALLPSMLGSGCEATGAHEDGIRRTFTPQPLSSADGWTTHRLMPRAGARFNRIAAVDLDTPGPNPVVMALDQVGRCWVLMREDGAWRTWETVHDHGGLSGMDQGEVDPRTRGAETFVGGAAGNLYVLGSHPQGAIDSRLIAHFPGVQIQAMLAGDLDPFSKGEELIVFTRPKGAARLRADGPHGTYTSEPIHGLDVGVRDALLLPFEVGKLPVFATASASGRIELASLTPEGPQRSILFDGASGVAGLARAPERFGRGPILYSCLDDGRVLRHQRRGSEAWDTETLYTCTAGPRGIVAGRLDPDPTVETVAVCTASGTITLLSRHDEHWSASPLFEGRGGAAGLALGEFDDRNSTDEILSCSTDGQILLHSRNGSTRTPTQTAP